jgi:histidyl-tRNA synthetase
MASKFQAPRGALGIRIGGGRHGGLIEQLGGVPTLAVSYGAGIERILLALNMVLGKQRATDPGNLVEEMTGGEA